MFSVLTTCYLINRTSAPLFQRLSAYKILFNKPHDYSHIKVSGCCVMLLYHHNGDKFAPRCVKGLFLGYLYAKKGYKILNLDTEQVFLSRDVKFIKTSFPFETITTTES